MKIVITGTTCSGKSTTIDILKNKGFNVIPEGAIQLIEEQKNLPNPILPNTDPEKFQEIILDRQLELESQIIESERFFLDRSMIDSFGYSNFYKVKSPDRLIDLAKNRYDKVFFLEPLPFFDNKFGFEDREMQLGIDEALRSAYDYFGYNFLTVPVMDSEKRVDFILSNLE